MEMNARICSRNSRTKVVLWADRLPRIEIASEQTAAGMRAPNLAAGSNSWSRGPFAPKVFAEEIRHRELKYPFENSYYA